MDVHRCRFVPFPPSSINVVSFSRPTATSKAHISVTRLAVGRANGDIEIWNPSNGSWHQELIMRGGKDRSIEGLVWVNEPDQDLGGGCTRVGRSRLFSIGYTSTVTEWDLEKGKPRRHANAQHSDIWCIAAQPAGPVAGGGSRAQVQPSNTLVAGTVGGELALYSVEDDDLCFRRLLVRAPTKKLQMVCITFQSHKVVIVGCSDSTIRAYDASTGNTRRRMTLGSDLEGGAKNIIVWCVKCLPNGNIVSGDSTGQICIWNGKTFTQTQRISSHKQDVLSLAISTDGSCIMSGSMDRKAFLYKMSPHTYRWDKVWGRRYHDHDVKSLASFEAHRMNVIVSGGPDAKMVVVPFKEMGRENHRTLSSLPQQPPMASAPEARFMASWWDRQVHIWLFRKPAFELFGSSGTDVNVKENRKLLKLIVVKGDSNISSAAISRDGKLLVVATAVEVKAFGLEHEKPARASDVRVRSLGLPQKLRESGANLVKLSPDGRWLCVIRNGTHILVSDIRTLQESTDTAPVSLKPQVLKRLHRETPRQLASGGLGSYDRNITQVDFSPDSKMLAVADLAGFIDTWTLPGLTGGNGVVDADPGADDGGVPSSGSESDEEEEQALDVTTRWIRNPKAKLIPKLPGVPAVMSFSDSTTKGDDGSVDYILTAITSHWHFVALHPRNASLTAWCRRNPRAYWPESIRELVDLPKGIVWDGSRIWIYGVSFLVMLDMGQDLDKPGSVAAATAATAHGTKRKRMGTASGAGGLNEKESMAPYKIRKHGDDDSHEDVDAREDRRESDDDGDGDGDDDEAGEANGELRRLRNDKGATTENADGDETAVTSAPRNKWWMTLKYRPVLGMAPLHKGDEPLEVALVERPAWETEMAERYVGEDEGDR